MRYPFLLADGIDRDGGAEFFVERNMADPHGLDRQHLAPAGFRDDRPPSTCGPACRTATGSWTACFPCRCTTVSP